jgi:cytochrome c556
MGNLGQSVRKQWPQEIEQIKAAREDRRRDDAFEETGQLAARLEAAAVEIPSAVSDADMSEADRAAFRDSAMLLKVQAKRLSKAAGDGDAERVRVLLNTIKVTCYGCHTQFREQAGPLSFGDE